MVDPVTITALFTAVIPFVTAGVKKVFTRSMEATDTRSGINAVIPLVLGILSAGLYTYRTTHNVWGAVAAGLGSGGVASSVRDIDKNLIGIVENVYKLVGKKDGI